MPRHGIPGVVPPRRVVVTPHGAPTPTPHPPAAPHTLHARSFQPATQGTLAAGAVVLNVVSLLCCLAVAWLYLKTPKARRSGTSKLVFFLAGASAALALSSAASEAGTSVACFAPPHTCRREHTAAWALLESTHIFLLRCAGAWSAAVALHLIRERLRASKILGYNFVTWQRGYHLLCWVGPAAHMQGCTLVNDWLGPRAASVALYGADFSVLLMVAGAVMHGASVGLLARLRHARSPPPGWVQLQVEEQRAVEEQRRGSSLSHTACLLPYCLALAFKVPFNILGTFRSGWSPPFAYLLARDVVPATHGILLLIAYRFSFPAHRALLSL